MVSISMRRRISLRDVSLPDLIVRLSCFYLVIIYCDLFLSPDNPHNKKHGGPSSKERHIGDLGNIIADASGLAVGFLDDVLVKLRGPFSCIGRSIIIHQGEDDLGEGGHELSMTTGNAGARAACGIIVEESPASRL